MEQNKLSKSFELLKEFALSYVSRHNIKDGAFEISGENLNEALLFSKRVIDYMNENGFLVDLQGQGEELSRVVGKHLAEVKNRFDVVDFDAKTINALLEIDLENVYNITSETAMNIQRSFISNIATGSSVESTLNLVSGMVDKTTAEIGTLLRTFENTYYQMVEKEVADNINYDGVWEYIGAPLQANSHAECRWVLSERGSVEFTREEMEAFEAGTYPPHLAGRSAVRYNCQHYFVMKGE